MILLGWALLTAILPAGCGRPAPSVPDRIQPNPNAPALYSNVPPPAASTSTTTATPAPTPSPDRAAWHAAPFAVLHTELSPATLVHCSGRYLGLFCDLPEFGLGSPAHVAWATKDGPRTFKPGQTHDVTGMEENWLLVWFAGATNWTNWDSPWAVFLQRKARWLRLDERGLHLEFPREAGDVVLMPLYGYFKPPPAGRDYLAEHGLPGRKLKTWEWEHGLARDPLTRLRFWAGATRQFPIHCEDSFSVDRGRDSVTFRSRFTWHAIADEWGTKPVKLAPLSPALGLVARDPEFPVRFSRKPLDMELPTLFGPHLAVQDVDSFEATVSVLQYVNETEATDPPDTNAHPMMAQALARLKDQAGEWANLVEKVRFSDDPGARWIEAERVLAFAPALPFLDAATRAVMQAKLERAAQALARGGALSPGLENLLHAYGQHTKDWPTVRRLTPSPLDPAAVGMTWAGFGPATTAEVTRDAERFAASARLAWQAGNIDAYHAAASLFTRATVHLWAKQRGAEWFRKQQPWHSMEWMDDEVFLTELRPDAGWSLDGPKFPANATQRAFPNRWRGCDDPDVTRFCREYLREDIRRELNWLQARWPRATSGEPAPGGPLSLVQLRSLLLHESPAEPARGAAPDQFRGSPADLIGGSLAVLRASRPARCERLIPGGPPGPFSISSGRDGSAPGTTLITELETCAIGLAPLRPTPPCWPRLVWPAWRSPSGAAWTFGRLKPLRDGLPTASKSEPLNRNTRAITFTLP